MLPPVNLRSITMDDDLLRDGKQTKLHQDPNLKLRISHADPVTIPKVTKIKIEIEKATPKAPSPKSPLKKVSPREQHRRTNNDSEVRRSLQRKIRKERADASSGLRKWVKARAAELGARSRSPEIIEKEILVDHSPRNRRPQYQTIQETGTPRSPTHMRGRKSKLNADLNHESLHVHRSESQQARDAEANAAVGVHTSEMNSINKSSMPTHAKTSLQSEYA